MIKFLAILLLVMLVLRVFNRMLFAPYVYKEQKPAPEPERKRQKEGSVTLEKNVKSNKHIPRDEGEFVDYEEVK